MQSSFLDLDLLKAESIRLVIKVAQVRSIPLLVFLRIVLFQAVDVLGHLLQDFGLEMTLRLARTKLRSDPVRSMLRGTKAAAIWQVAIEFPFFGGWRRFEGVMSIRGVCENPLLGL